MRKLEKAPYLELDAIVLPAEVAQLRVDMFLKCVPFRFRVCKKKKRTTRNW